MGYSRIRYAVAERKAKITLSRPEKRNAVDDIMVQELTAAFTAAGKDSSVRVIVLDHQGSVFSAGADLAYLGRMSQFDLEHNLADSRTLAHLFRLIMEIRKPVIAAVDGPALAGGCGLATCCDFVLASAEHAVFGYPEVRIGFIPAIVSVVLLRRIPEGKVRELIVSGNTIDASEAMRLGLVTGVHAAQDLPAAVEQLAGELATRNSLTAMGLCKELLARVGGMNFPDALELAANMNAAARMTADCKAGVEAFLHKEQKNW